jgi:hypothetical protein
MKMLLKFTLVGIVGLVLFGVIAFYVDYYYYSWTSYIPLIGGNYKEIRTVEYSGKEKLENSYDLARLYSSLDSQNYTASFISPRLLKVSREFNGVEYIIEFEEYIIAGTSVMNVSFGNKNLGLPSFKGESPITPTNYIKNNISKMILEMPLTPIQQTELHNKVRVTPITEIGIH